MLSTLGKLASKPSNAKIRITRIVFALLLTASIVFGFFATDVNVSFFDIELVNIPDEYNIYILPVLFIFPLVGLVRGIFDPGLFRKAIWKKVIISLGIAMMIISVFFLSEKPYIPAVQTTSEINAETEQQRKHDAYVLFATMPTDNLLFFFGFITLFVGLFLNNKNLTTKNEKYGEVIKKIRV